MQQKCCVASCKKIRTILYFSQRWDTSCCMWHVNRNSRRNFVKMSQSERLLRLRRFQDGGRRKAHCKLRKNNANVWHLLCNLQCFSGVIVALQAAREIASCNMAVRWSLFKVTSMSYLVIQYAVKYTEDDALLKKNDSSEKNYNLYLIY